jgi:hypothetical protein
MKLAKSETEMTEEVGWQERFFTFPAGKERQFRGPSADPGSHSSGIAGSKFRPEEGAAHSGQNIPHTSGRHSGVAGGVIA